MNPQPADTVLNPEKTMLVRRLDCINYERCLTVAADSNWSGFHCNDCLAYAPKDEEERKADARAIREAYKRARS